MLKALALVLLVTVAACKTDDAPAARAPAGGASSQSATPAGPKPRSGKIEAPQRAPSLPGTAGEAEAPAGDSADDEVAGRRRVLRRERMMTIDTDGDGVISDEERAAARQRREANMLARLDADGDGKLSEEERAAARRMRTDEMRTRLDANGDGKVTADEIGNSRRAGGLQMQEADTIGDGDVSAEELETALRERGSRRARGRFGGNGDEPAAPTR
jgi:hypothetical protein